MKTVLLGDVVDFYSGGTPSKSSPEFWDGDVPWFSPKDMKQSRLTNSVDHISKTAFDKTSLRRLPAGTIAIVVRGMILAHTVPISILDVDAAINQDLKALIPKRPIHSGFLAAMLRAQHSSILSQVSTAAHGTKKLDSRVLEEIPIPDVPEHEQRRIAAILDAADTIRTKRRQVLAHVDALTQSIFNEMFADIPATSTVEAGASLIRTGPFGSQLLHSEFVDQGIAVLGLDNVVGNEFRWGERRFITPAKYEKLKRYTVRPGDVLISIMGTTGRCVVVPDDIPTAINTKHICAITPDSSRLHSTFLRAAFLWHPESLAHLRRQTKGSIMDGLNMGIIKSMPIPVPPLSAQHEFAEQAEHVATSRGTMTRASNADDELFDSLQARAFAGRL